MDAAARPADGQSAGDQGLDRAAVGPRGRQGIVGYHQRRMDGTLDHAGKFAGAWRLGDGGVEGHHPTVDFRGYFVAEFNGEGGIAAGQVPNAHIC